MSIIIPSPGVRANRIQLEVGGTVFSYLRDDSEVNSRADSWHRVSSVRSSKPQGESVTSSQLVNVLTNVIDAH
jgi:hypothetical protein